MRGIERFLHGPNTDTYRRADGLSDNEIADAVAGGEELISGWQLVKRRAPRVAGESDEQIRRSASDN